MCSSLHFFRKVRQTPSAGPVNAGGQDQTGDLLEAVRLAAAERRTLAISGGGSKRFYGRRISADRTLSLAGHSGIVTYEPSELVLTARAGTPLLAIESLLDRHGQMLGFEPPHFGPAATLGGTIACGLSGPRRPFAGAARDAVLGVKLINGRGDPLAMGGRVLKNVAGFDVARLMVGAQGTLGVLLEISLRVLPKPETELTVAIECDQARAMEHMRRLQRQDWPISGLAFADGRLLMRLAGAERAVAAAVARLGGDAVTAGAEFWQALREQQLPFFAQAGDLWRFSLPPAAPVKSHFEGAVIDWGGALRWLQDGTGGADPFVLARSLGGHACLFRGAGPSRWQPLAAPLLALHRRIKSAFDPDRILNPGRYADDW